MSIAISSPPAAPKAGLHVAAIALVLVAALLSWLGFALQPKMVGVTMTQAEFDKLFPSEFGDWQELKGLTPLVSAANPGELTFNQPYDAQSMRTYRNTRSGQVVMLALAYGQNQRQDIKVHRPEVCYNAQGWDVVDLGPHQFPLTSSTGVPITGMHMRAVDKRSGRDEAVTYWVRIGDTFSQSGMTQRLHILQQGLQGKRSDGVLVRFSQHLRGSQTPQESHQVQAQFAKDFLAALSPEARQLLTH